MLKPVERTDQCRRCTTRYAVNIKMPEHSTHAVAYFGAQSPDQMQYVIALPDAVDITVSI